MSRMWKKSYIDTIFSVCLNFDNYVNSRMEAHIKFVLVQECKCSNTKDWLDSDLSGLGILEKKINKSKKNHIIIWKDLKEKL